MAGYIRQSSFSDGDTITAALFNNEYNQILNAFSNTSGHAHDGTTAEGPVIGLIGDAGETAPNNKVLIDTTNNFIEFYVQVSSSPVQQLYIADGAVIPVTDSDIDLGTTSLRFKDTYTDTVTTTGNVSVGGNLTVTGTTTFNGGTITMGDAATDNVVFGADINSSIIPNTDDTYDLGSASQEWRDLYLDGTAHIDTLDVDVNATIAGTLGVTGVLTGTSLDISGDIDVDGTTNLDVVDIDGAVDMATTLAVAGNVDFNGDLDVDGTTNLDVVDIDGAVDMATTLTVGGEVTAASLDISGNVDIDGTLETDALSLNGTTVTASAADINLIDGITNGTVIASKAIVTDANIDITGGRNITISGELDAATLDISGDADIDGTLEADAITIGGVTLAETISDTVGAMVSSNTETNITVTYDDSDNTLDFVIGTLNQDTTGLAATATALATARTIHGVSFDGTANIDLSEVISDTVGAMVSSNTETNITVAYQDADNTLDFTIGTLNQDTTGNAGTATALATARTIGGTSFDGTANIAVGLADTATILATARTIGGVSFNGSANIDLPGVNTAGNQNTTGSAATLTTARTIGGVSFNGSANIDLPGVNSAGNQNTTGTAATVTTAAQTNITSLGTLTTLTVDNIIINGTNIGHTSDTDSIAIASNGVVTFSQIPVLPANSIDSDYYVDGSIDTAHIADSQITVAKMAANSVDSDQYVDGSIDTAHYADNSITGAELADNIDIAGTFDVTGATTLDSTLVVAGIATASTSAKITQVAITSSSAAVAWDAAAAANAYHVTTENTTFSAPSNAVEGAIISVELAQGGTPRTIAWNTVFEFAASTAPTVTATANKTDIFSFRYNGSVWQEIGRVQNMAQT